MNPYGINLTKEVIIKCLKYFTKDEDEEEIKSQGNISDNA